MKLLDDFNIKTDNMEIYDIAFSHSSYCNEHNLPRDYQRLEFLGDKVLDLIMSDYLYNTTDYEVGKMTKIRSMYVCENALYEYANILNFKDYAKLGIGEEKNNARERNSLLADIFESFIGALYLSNGYDDVKKILENTIDIVDHPELTGVVDYKTRLQEYVQSDSRKVLQYTLLRETGPSNEPQFEIGVYLDNVLLGTGIEHTKKKAEQLAAKEALGKLVK